MSGYRVRRDVKAGCHQCHGHYEVGWTSPNAQGVAARHAQAHGHSTWVEVYMSVGYGPKFESTGRPDPARNEASGETTKST